MNIIAQMFGNTIGHVGDLFGQFGVIRGILGDMLLLEGLLIGAMD